MINSEASRGRRMLSRLLVQLGMMFTNSTTTSKARGYSKQHTRPKRVSRIDWFFSLPIPTSFSHLLVCVLLSSRALAYRNVQLHHPGNITSCVPVNITWHGGTHPFTLEIIPQYPLSWVVPKTHRDGLHVDHLVEYFYLWPPNFPRASRVRIRVSDRTSTSGWVRGRILGNTGGCTDIVVPPNTTTSIETVTSTLTVSTFTFMPAPPLTRTGDTSPIGKWKTSMTVAVGAVGMVALSTLLLIFFRCRYLRRHARDRAQGSGEHNGVWSDWTDYEQEAGGSSETGPVMGALLPEEPEPQPRPSLTSTGRLTGRSQAPLPLVRATPMSRMGLRNQRAGETAPAFRPFVHSRKVVLSAVVEQDESSSIGHHSAVKGVDGSTETLNDSGRMVEDPALEPVDRDAHERQQDTVTPILTEPRSSGPYVAVERSETASSGGTDEILRVLSEVISKDPSRALQYPLQNAGVTGGRERYGSGTSGGRSDTISSIYPDSLAAPSSPDIDPHLTHLTPLSPISSLAVGSGTRSTTFPTTGRSSDFESRLRAAVLSLQRNPSTSSSAAAVAASIRSGSFSSRHASSLGTIPSSPDIDPYFPPVSILFKPCILAL
ncbi:hypothetical protein C8Q74DRAFT_335648 [Fomes fomentarius]|nr:hypothetical protein C8Q74DRAFT_335648 [Fomes fomentarius]